MLNALFHHALFIIPQQEIPGQMPSAFIMRHPTSGNVEVWWSPCPSRECPEEEEINIVVDSCVDYCLLLEQNPKIEVIAQTVTKSPMYRNDDLDDLNFKVSKKKPTNQTKEKNLQSTDSSTETPNRVFSESTLKYSLMNRTVGNISIFDAEGSDEESWVADSGEAAFFRLDMHPDLGTP